jgi:hypothetical protein
MVLESKSYGVREKIAEARVQDNLNVGCSMVLTARTETRGEYES